MAFSLLTKPATTVVPAALNSSVYWYDSGSTYTGEILYYDASGAYAYWYNGTIWVITAEADVGSLGTNYFNDSLVGQGAWSGTLSLYSGCASNWEWQVIGRNRDYTSINGTDYYRENWQLSRFRFSNLPYVSELGDTATELLGYNANVAEQVEPPSFNTLYPLANFASVTGYYGTVDLTGYPFYPAQWNLANGVVAYVSPWGLPVSTSVLICDAGDVPVIISDDGGLTYYMAAEPRSIAQSGELTYKNLATYSLNNKLVSAAWTPDASGNPENTGEIEFSDAEIPFRCTSDIQTYDQRAVDWFKQTQTWVVKSPWA